jgi:cell division protein FtsI (penicillin-binding protein 3)
VGAAVLVARAVQLQVVETSEWRRIAAAQQRATEEIVAARGTIVDRDGVPLALSRERFRVGIDPDALRSREDARRLLEDVLDVSAATAERVTDPSDPWHVVPGRYPPSVREALGGVRGIHLQREVERFYPHGALARGVLGTVVDGRGRGGVEERYEEVLRGRPGRQVLAKDSEGRAIPGAVVQVEPTHPGGVVRLTLDLDLQEIAQEALAEAVESTHARGGDILVSDPRTGDVLALVSMEGGHARALSAINAPFEPGSTFKPFTAAALLENGLARLGDTVYAEHGRWIAPDGRPLEDVVPHDSITLAEALRVSSNVGVAKAAMRLSYAQQYRALRDFGFGVETGIALPGEVSGLLRRPDAWTARSPVSLAIGYEASVTPLQMTMAYGALANGGRLMEPRLVREVRSGEGRLVERKDPRQIRQVVSPWVTEALADVLVDVVEEGTGTAARLGTFRVAGKSGTSRAYVPGRGYVPGRYFASFVGFFPADDPQLVIFVKLDSPRGRYYGGATAAPVTRATMEAVLAARRAPIDREALIEANRADAPAPSRASVRFATLSIDRPESTRPDGAAGAATAGSPEDGAGAVVVPDVRGLPGRIAARRLHAVGLRVRWEGAGAAGRTDPSPGAVVTVGDTVLVRARPGAPPGGGRGRAQR